MAKVARTFLTSLFSLVFFTNMILISVFNNFSFIITYFQDLHYN